MSDTTSPRWRVVYMGTPELAAEVLRALVAEDWLDVVGVVTQPDRIRGRHKAPQPPPVKVVAEQAAIPVVQPTRLRDPEFLDWLRSREADIGVVAAYGKILPVSVLGTPRLGCLNVHASLLPRHRGAAPIQYAIAAGDTETGVTIMQMDEGLDTGPMLTKQSTPIALDDTAETVHDRLAQIGGELLLRTLQTGREKGFSPDLQPEEGVTWAPTLQRSDGEVDWSQPSEVIQRRVRAFYPWPGATSEIRGQAVKLFPFPPRDVPAELARAAPDACAGEVVAIDDAGVWVRTGTQPVCLTELQLAGRKRLPASDVARGLRLELGDRFAAPQSN